VINKPDVIIMDLAMPDTDGFSATAEISRVAPEVAVLVLTMSDDDITVTKAMRAGRSWLLAQGRNQGGDPASRDGCRGRPGDLRTRRCPACAGPTERDVHRRRSISSADPA
jgi:hypothetical protein